MKFTRRDLLIGGAGLAAGFLFTPVPWKLLSDSATWTQNWPWIAQGRGPVETKTSFCTVCAGGCGVRVRTAGGYPVGVNGLRSDPVTHGALCPLAFAAQQLNWAPQRLREVRHSERAPRAIDAGATRAEAAVVAGGDVRERVLVGAGAGVYQSGLALAAVGTELRQREGMRADAKHGAQASAGQGGQGSTGASAGAGKGWQGLAGIAAGARQNARAASWAEAQAAFQRACAEGPVMILDGRPGRAASSIFEQFCATHKGNYQAVLGPESRALEPYAEWSGVPVSALGYDLENAGTIVSFGAPLLDGWGTPGRFTRLWSERGASADPTLRLVQVDSFLSHTAALAWRWTLIREGSDAALAAGIAQVLLEERLVKPPGPVPQMSLADAAAQTGLTAGAIRDLARTIVQKTPVVVIAADRNPAVAALNVLLGAIGKPGGIVQKRGQIQPSTAASAVTSTPRAVLVDSTVPWEFVPPVGAEVFRFAAWDGGDNKADWLLPAPGFLEETTDVPTAPTSAVETYAIAAALTAPPANVMSAAQFLAKIDTSLPTAETVIHNRCQALFNSRLGTLVQDQAVPVAKVDSVQKLEDALHKGAVWVGDRPHSSEFRCELNAWPTEGNPAADTGWTRSWALPVLPALSTKLYRESDLREPPQRA
jgi:hypothetical protein